MEDNRNVPSQYEEYDEIDIMELVRKLLKEWKLILKYCSIAAVLGLIIGFSIPKEYTVTSKLAPEVASKSGGGSLSSLASLAGINLGAMSTSDAMSPELYPEIVSSKPFIIELFSMPVQVKDGKDVVETDLYDYMKDYTRAPWWGVVISAPFKALGWFMGLFRDKPGVVEGYTDIDPYSLTLEQAKILKAINESISVMVDKKNYIISLTVTSQNPKVAADLSEAIIENLRSYITNYRTEKSRHDLAYYEQLYSEAKDAYYKAQQKYAKYVDANQGVVRQSVLIEQQRLQNESNLAYELYNQTAQQVQLAKAKVQQETPVCTVIQPPAIPLQRSKPSKLTILVGFIFLGGCAAAAWILWGRGFMADLKKKDDDE